MRAEHRPAAFAVLQGAHKFADASSRLEAGASQHEHSRLRGMNDAAFDELCERGASDGGGRLDVEADPAEFE